MRVIEPGKGRVRIGVAGNRTRVELRDDETPVGHLRARYTLTCSTRERIG